MGLVVNFLAAKVPEVDAKFLLIVKGKAPLDDLNAVGGVFVGVQFVVGVLNLFGQGGFARAPFAHDEKFSFV
jgi:hypothetical protein